MTEMFSADVFFCVEKPSCFWEQTICCSWQEGFCFQHSKICPQAWACIVDYASIVLSMIEQNGGDFISWTVIRFLIRQSLIFGKCKISENLLTLPMIF